MPRCNGCSESFPAMQDKICKICEALQKLPMDSPPEMIQKISNTPQCRSCGVIYNFLCGPMCGACKEKEDMPPPPNNLPKDAPLLEDMAQRTLAFEATASLHRLNQKPGSSRKPNHSLAKANLANLQKSQASSRLKSEMIHIFVNLFIREGAKTQKAGLDVISFAYQNSETLSVVLANIQKRAKEAYEASSIGKASNCPGEYNFDQPTYSVGNSTSAVHLHITEALAVGSLQAFFAYCQASRMLSERDIKNRQVYLKITVLPLVMLADEDAYRSQLAYASKKASSKRKGAPLSPGKAQTSRRVKAYTSEYQSTESVTSMYPPGIVPLDFDTFTFKKGIWTINMADGTDDYNVVEENDSIEICRGWKAHMRGSADLATGFLGKGYSKYAFLGHYQGNNVCVLQCGIHGSTIDENRTELLAELRLLFMGQWFCESFHRRAMAERCTVPSIRFNAMGAFIGEVQSIDLDKCAEDKSGLTWPTFLVAPLLPTKGLYRQRKFSGSAQIGQNEGAEGQAADAFVHHIFEDSRGEIMFADIQGVVGPGPSLILFDPQAHTIRKNAGPNDKGVVELERFAKEHICNKMCEALVLDPPADLLAAAKKRLEM